jgi:hypothetical protein
MPPVQTYNPIVVGFVEGEGYVNIPLQAAREEYGQLPSEYGLLPQTQGRHTRKALNLPLGLAILRQLENDWDFPGNMARFYERWGRDFQADFGVNPESFHRRNDPWALTRILEENRDLLWDSRILDPREYLVAQKLISAATLQSIPGKTLLAKAKTILEKKRRNPAHRHEQPALTQAITHLGVTELLDELGRLCGDPARSGRGRLDVHADEAAVLLWRLSTYLPLAGLERLECVRGEGVEFGFAPRDRSFLELGKEVGDCTADKSFRQVDRDVENIYWTVFAWFLDRNYQILTVHCDGRLVMKVHLLPLLASHEAGEAMILAVDAIETTPAFREDTPASDPDLVEKKEYVFARMVDETRRLAAAMGIEHVVAERFSNTPWVRRELATFPETYLHIGHVRKIDEMEDVFELAKKVCVAAGQEAPRGVFMELQMKNTQLLPGVATVRGVKTFALLAGNARVGMPLKRVVGV